MTGEAPQSYQEYIPGEDGDEDRHHFDQLARLRPQDTVIDFYISGAESGKQDVDQPEAVEAINDFAERVGIPRVGWSESLLLSNRLVGRELDIDEAVDAEQAGESLGTFVTMIAWIALPLEEPAEEDGSASSFTLKAAERIITIHADGEVWVNEHIKKALSVGWALRYSATIEPDAQSSA